MEIVKWLDYHKLDYKLLGENVFSINEEIYVSLEEKEKILNQNFDLIPSQDEIEVLDKYPNAKIAFKFGNNWYWTHSNGETVLNPLRYIGQIKKTNKFANVIPFLGIHAKFELLNGSRDYNDWCIKAKFLGIDTIAIVEQQTLAGTMLFQEACVNNGINSIIGHTAVVTTSKTSYKIKLYVKNQIGWRNLLKINKYQNVDNERLKTIPESELIKYTEGLIGVINADSELKEHSAIKLIQNFENLYFGLEFTKWIGATRDREFLDNTQKYIDNYLHKIKPVFIQDAYYLDSIDADSKKHLNNIGKVKDQYLSKDQYFKDCEQIFDEFFELFPNTENSLNLYDQACKNTIELSELCEFKIKTDNRYLPKYKMSEQEKEKFEDNEDLFNFLVLKGYEEKILPKIKDDPELIEKYLERISEESEILIEGKVADYFLILGDVCGWCKQNGILVGHGRGSAGGSLISYLLGIIEIDPIEYNLLFSRFLTRGRLKGSLPDIDIDFSDREKAIEYIKDKYGKNYVASVATYGNLKVKNAIKDFGRIYGLDPKITNYITGFINKEHEASDFTKLLKFANSDDRFKQFLIKNSKVFEFFDILLHQTRTASIHACATIVVPDVDENGFKVDIHDLVPCKIMDGELVTEWEGAQLEKAGFLKEDILGLKQLEKFDGLLKLIKNSYNKEINIYDIDLKDPQVFDLFSEGLTEDVFQFGSDGLKAYCKFLKPNSIEELTAANALYRPGAMESNAHIDFVDIKFGKKKPDYDFLLEDVTKNTYGLYIYQEQIMQAYAKITEVDLESADKFRKYITKAYKLKSKGLIDTEYEKYEKEFIDKYCAKGQSKDAAQLVWDKLVAFASYGFNRSHAAAYAIISYISQWFKQKYPIEFWTISLNEASDDDRPKRITEIEKVGGIKINPVDVNESELVFKGSLEHKAIFWSLSSVKWLGEKAAKIIIEEREINGRFFGMKEFISRVKKSSVNKRSITNLILSGGFDKMYNIKEENQRLYILDEFYHEISAKNDIEAFTPYKNNKVWWQMKQTELTGFGGISYEFLSKQNNYKENFISDLETSKVDSYVTTGGIVVQAKIKNSKKIGDFGILLLNCNNNLNSVMVWNETLEQFREQIVNSEGSILLLNGRVKLDSFSNKNSLQTNRTTKIVKI